MSNHQDKWSLKTHWVVRRNAVLGSGGFQRWASRLPIIRSIARRRASAQFDLVAGFVYSQILLAHVETGLIGFLAVQPRPFDDIADFLKLRPDAAERLLLAGAALELVESPQPGLWALGEAGAPLSANPGAMAMIRHHHLLYRDLADPLDLLANDRGQETALSAFWAYASKESPKGASAQDYTALMAATQPMVAHQIINAYDFGQHNRMLDIGGGSGGFTTAVMSAVPTLSCGIFDLPDVIACAESRLADTTSSRPITLHRGSFKNTDLPSGYDLITVVRILHDHDDDVVEALLARVHAALPDNGKLLIVEPMAQTASAPRMGDAYFGLYLWAMGSGRPRSPATLRAMLKRAGFSGVKTVHTALPLITSALVATR